MSVSPLEFALIIFVFAIMAGMLGSLLGLGGGIVMIPVLTLLLKVDMRYAVAASIVSVIATSSGAAAAYVRERMTNLRVAMFLEIATTTGAVTGALLIGLIQQRWLFVLFGLVLGYSALVMLRKRHELAGENVPADPWADRLKLHGAYFDHAAGHEVQYRVARSKLSLGLMLIAGTLSALLGIGSGTLKVPAMDLAMRLPIKVSTATSNFMIGVTAAASAAYYFMRGDVNPIIAAPVAAGVLIGALIGARLLGRLHSRAIRILFVIVLLYVSAQMLIKGIWFRHG